jgi:hypothetical protein
MLYFYEKVMKEEDSVFRFGDYGFYGFGQIWTDLES